MRLIPFLLLTAPLLTAMELQPGGAGVEFRQPQLAAAHGQVALAYGAGSAIWFATSADGGRTFGQRVKVAESGALALGRHRGPRVTILKDAILVTAVTGAAASHAEHAHGVPDRGDLTGWRSVDGGKTWSKTAMVTDAPAAAEEGLHSIIADAHENLYAAWLDHRGKGTELYGAKSTDRGRTWGKNVRIYASPEGTICQCCNPSLAVDAKGDIEIMWRNALAGSRDMYVAKTSDFVHFSAPQKVGQGTWKLEACPMDGGSLVNDHGRMLSAWRRETAVFVDEPGKAEVRVGEGHDVALEVGAKGAYVMWAGKAGIELLRPGAKAPETLAGEGGFPAMVALDDGAMLAAWEEQGTIRVERLP